MGVGNLIEIPGWQREEILSRQEREQQSNIDLFEERWKKSIIEQFLRERIYNGEEFGIRDFVHQENIRLGLDMSDETIEDISRIGDNIKLRQNATQEWLQNPTLSGYKNYHKEIVRGSVHLSARFDIGKVLSARGSPGRSYQQLPVIISHIKSDKVLKHEIEHQEQEDDINRERSYSDDISNLLRGFDGNFIGFKKSLDSIFDSVINSSQKGELLSFFVSGDRQKVKRNYDNEHFGGIKRVFEEGLQNSKFNNTVKKALKGFFWQTYKDRESNIDNAWKAMEILVNKGVERERISPIMRQISLSQWLKFAEDAPNLKKLQGLDSLRKSVVPKSYLNLNPFEEHKEWDFSSRKF